MLPVFRTYISIVRVLSLLAAIHVFAPVSAVPWSDGSFYTASEAVNDEKEQNVTGLLLVCSSFCYRLSR